MRELPRQSSSGLRARLGLVLACTWSLTIHGAFAQAPNAMSPQAPAPASAAGQSPSAVRPIASAVVTIANGPLGGELLPDGTVTFRGIPFAQPPIGSRRWKPPEAVAPWTDVREALVSGPPCLQAPLGWNNQDAVRSREDCLYLDVRTPELSPTARKPVMVWIHGGANWAGSGSGYLTSNIVQRGVVLVTFQYRLGVFGFLSHPALTAESNQKTSGNYGLLDQIAALQWVKANIAKFGGDPNNVTLFGQSAGGQDVGLLMLSPLAKGLFAKAIEQSGTAGFGLPARTLAENERIGEAIAAKLGVPPGSPTALESLRAAYPTSLLAAGNKIDAPALDDDSFIWLQPVVDGYVLPRAPADLLAEHKEPPVPLLIGSAAREFALYGGEKNARHAVEAAFGANAARAMPLYGLDQPKLPLPDARLGDIPTQIAADINFRCPVTVVSRQHQAAGARVWQYQFDVPAPDAHGVVKHGAELAYVFNGLPVVTASAQPVLAAAPSAPSKPALSSTTSTRSDDWKPAETAMVLEAASERAAPTAPNPPSSAPPAANNGGPSAPPPTLQAYWVRFAMTGDPNGPGLPRWPEYARKREYLEFTESAPIAKRDLRAAICEMLSSP